MTSLTYILELDNKALIAILKDISFRKYLFLQCDLHQIKDFLDKLPKNLLIKLFDEESRNLLADYGVIGYDIIILIMNDHKIFSDDFKYYFLNNPIIFEILYKNTKDAYGIINFNGLNYIKYVCSKYKNGISHFEFLNTFQKSMILNDPEGKELLIKHNCLPYMNLFDYKREKLEKIFELPNYLNYFLSLDYKIILEIISSDTNINFPKGFIENEQVINRILEYQNINLLRLYLERIKKNRPNYYYLLNKALKKKQINEIKEIDRDTFELPNTTILRSNFYSNPNGFFKHLNDIGLNLSCLINLSKFNINETFSSFNISYFKDILIDYFFEVSPYNFLKDLHEMLNYLELSNKSLIPFERINTYSRIANINKLNWNERMDLYKELLNTNNLQETFYDDYKTIKNDSVNDINSHLITKEKIINNSTRNIEGVPVYYLKGEPFGALINVTSTMRAEPLLHQIWYETSSTISTSIISNDNLNSINGYNNICVVVGFNKLKEDRLIHTYHSDSFTEHEKGTNNVCRLLSFEELIKQTKGYNELLLLQRNELKCDNLTDSDKMIYPDFVVSYNSIAKTDIDVAKALNVPILLIYTHYYKYNDNYLEAIDTTNEYITLR